MYTYVNVLNPILITASVAQWIRHRPPKPGIAGSSPAGGFYGGGGVKDFNDFYFYFVNVTFFCLKTIMRHKVLTFLLCYYFIKFTRHTSKLVTNLRCRLNSGPTRIADVISHNYDVYIVKF